MGNLFCHDQSAKNQNFNDLNIEEPRVGFKRPARDTCMDEQHLLTKQHQGLVCTKLRLRYEVSRLQDIINCKSLYGTEAFRPRLELCKQKLKQFDMVPLSGYEDMPRKFPETAYPEFGPPMKYV